MAEGEFDDIEMQDLGQKYPEYNDMNYQQLNHEYQNLTQERLDLLRGDSNNVKLDDVKK